MEVGKHSPGMIKATDGADKFLREVDEQQAQVDQALELLLDRVEVWPEARARPTLALLELGLQHEQQHQELLLMDLLDGFSRRWQGFS